MASLFVHKQQYIFTEIEAEVNLCFDQILYSLSEQIFTHFKSRASLMLLHTKRSVQDVEASGDKIAAQAMGKNWYMSLLSHHHLQLLGRSIDLSRLLCQRMNNMLRRSLDLAIARFESKDLTSILELVADDEVVRLS